MRSVRWTLAAWAIVVACNGGDITSEQTYATASEAARAKAIERGVVPKWLPESATDIHVASDLDSGVVAVHFAIPSDLDLSQYVRSEPIRQEIDDSAIRGQFGVDSWPPCAKHPQGACAGFRYFVLRGLAAAPLSYVAEDLENHRVYWLGKQG